MASEIAHQLHMLFLPFMSPSHMIPMVDMARLFAAHGVKVTIIVTPLNAPLFQNAIDRDVKSGRQIGLHILKFPSVEAGLPEGCESLNSVTSPEMSINFFKAIDMLHQPFNQLLSALLPDCIVYDVLFAWTADLAAEFQIPRLSYQGISFFSLCISYAMNRYAPHDNVSSDNETFVVHGLPDHIELTRSQLPDFVKTKSWFSEFLQRVHESERRSYGSVLNSFYEMEPAYVEHLRMAFGSKAWHVGPVSVFNRDTTDKAERGNKASIDEHDCLSWLDSKKSNSVLYICFGSMARFTNEQLREIASALEAFAHPFIWVVRKIDKSSEGFEESIEGKGVIIRDWAPQALILDHPAIGGFVTHCGWNSLLEGISSGVPMITWPQFAEQFYNEKLVTQVLRTGVGVGADVLIDWTNKDRPLVKREQIEKAVNRLMDGGDEAQEMRNRARELGEMAKRAVEVGGSSYADLTNLIEELRLIKVQKNPNSS